MNNFLFLGIVICSILSILLIWLLVVIFKEKEIPSDDAIFKNFMPQFTKGYSNGTINEIKQYDDRLGIVFTPKDVNLVNLFKNKNKIEITPEIIWVEKSKFKIFPRGFLSGHRHEVWALPPRAEDLPEQFKKTDIGDFLMNSIEDSNSRNEETKILRNRVKVQNKLVTKTEGLELVDDYLSKVNEITKDVTKLIPQQEKKQDFGTDFRRPN